MRKIFSIFCLVLVSLASDIKTELIKNWQALNENVIIDELNISSDDYANCRLIDYPLLSNQGFFKADCNGIIKQFRFSLKAKKKVYKLKRNILREENIGILDLKLITLDLNKAPYNAITNINQPLKAKSNIKANSILKTSMLMPNYLINKDDNVVGIIDDGDLSVFIDLIALQSGVKGQKIRLKNTQGKNLSGEVINEKQVLIR